MTEGKNPLTKLRYVAALLAALSSPTRGEDDIVQAALSNRTSVSVIILPPGGGG